MHLLDFFYLLGEFIASSIILCFGYLVVFNRFFCRRIDGNILIKAMKTVLTIYGPVYIGSFILPMGILLTVMPLPLLILAVGSVITANLYQSKIPALALIMAAAAIYTAVRMLLCITLIYM